MSERNMIGIAMLVAAAIWFIVFLGCAVGWSKAAIIVGTTIGATTFLVIACSLATEPKP